MIDSGDVEAAIRHVVEHFGAQANSQLIFLCNPVEAEEIAGFRAGEENHDGQTAKFSFIPSTGAPAYLTEENIVGQIAPAEYAGLKDNGSYGSAWVIETWRLQPGCAICFLTWDAGSTRNVVARCEHTNPAYRGLLAIPGRDQRYALVDTFFSRTVGRGVAQRGAAVVVQVKESGGHEVPVMPS